MQISCPRCATSYELDERVLPPGGAPVQCTRCSHVFTAHAPPRPGYATQIFGAPQVPATDSPGADDEPEPPPPEERTQIYGRNAAPEPASSSAGSRATQIFGSTVGQPPPSHKTQIFGAGSLEATQERPTERTQVFGRGSAPGDALPPAGDPPWVSAHRRAVFAADPSAIARATRMRRRRIVLGVLVAIVLAAIGGAGLRAWIERGKGIPPEAQAALSQAVTSLRRDDPASLAEARAKLQGVVHAWPGYLEARATHLVAMLFQLDDARMELQRLTDETTAINTQINELTEQQSQPDSQDSRDQVNALVDRLGELKAQIDPAAERTAVLDGEVNDAFQALQQAAAVGPSPQDEIHLIRAQALYFGVKGSEQALALSERYRAKGGQEGWGDLAWAEYALNARSAPDTLRQAREALEVLRASDPSWVRLYVLIGRLALAEEALDAATTALDSAITLNPKHQTAQTLLRLAEGHKKQATADEFAP